MAGEPREAGLRLAPPFEPDRSSSGRARGVWGSTSLWCSPASITHLLIAGFLFELGADCTWGGQRLGYECLLIEDCCSGMADDTFRGAVSSVTMSGGIWGGRQFRRC